MLAMHKAAYSFFRVAPLVLLLVLPACSSWDGSWHPHLMGGGDTADLSAPGWPQPSAAEALPGARMGDHVALKGEGATQLTVTEEYISASGAQCRHYTLATSTSPAGSYLACREVGTHLWRPVRAFGEVVPAAQMPNPPNG